MNMMLKPHFGLSLSLSQSQKDKADRMRSIGSIETGYICAMNARFPFAYLLLNYSAFYRERCTNCLEDLHDAQSRRCSMARSKY